VKAFVQGLRPERTARFHPPNQALSMPRFLHTADWQIGRQYAQFPHDDAVLLAEERITAVERIAALARDHEIDAVLVAGDVFDAQTVSDRTIRKLFAAMSGFAGPWVMIPGNHDAALAESVWSRARRLGVLPPNLRLALNPGVIELPALATAVLAAPLTQRHTYDDTTGFFDSTATPDGWLRIGLAHGCVEGILAGDIDSANPIAATRCASARLDYLALGDWHGMRLVNERCAYSGTPEQDRFKGNEPGYCLLVDADGATPPRIDTLRTGRYHWRTLAHRIDVGSDVDQVCATLAALQANDVVQLEISGQTDLSGFQRLQAALAGAEAQVRSLLSDLTQLRLLPTDDDIAALQADGYLAEVISELRLEQAPGGPVERAALAREALALLCTEISTAASPAGAR
jgi:DNA repair exonuclease SbcCD nuclease subunit